MNRDKKLLICLMIIQKLNLKTFTNQDKIKQQDINTKTNASKITNSSCTSKSRQ